MATAVINGIVVTGTTHEIYELIQKATTTVSIATSTTPIIFGEGLENAKGKL